MRFIAALAAGLLFSVGALADAGHEHGAAAPYGEPGDPAVNSRVVTIGMDETAKGKMVFRPSKVVVQQGEQIRFVFENHGDLDHEFVLGTAEEIEEHAALMRKFPEMEHDDPNSERVVASAKGELVWKFTNAGEFDFACLIPGHMESGMVGKVTVK